MSESYRTVARDAEATREVKRSRFLARVRGVTSEPQARAVIEKARGDFWEARHHCSAFVLGVDGAVARSCDDGEPAGTAGMPILDAVRGAGLSDVVVVVTRWFGGTLLGTGGLVKAYSGAASDALAAAGVRTRTLMSECTLRLAHADAGRIESDLIRLGVHVIDRDYTDTVTLTLGAPPSGLDELRRQVAELTAGAGEIEVVAERWVG